MNQREIKFRAWGKAWGDKEPQMHNSNNVAVLSDSVLLYGGHHLETLEYSLKEFPDLKVMQFTGLHDKNGKDIYEGDIVRCNYASNVNPQDRDDSNYFDNRKRIGLIEWKTSEGRWTYKGESHYRMDETYQMEVIGNIYENPNLILKTKETFDGRESGLWE